MERVNRYFGYGAVSRIAIRQGAAAPPGDKEAERRVPGPVSAETTAELKAVADDDLRAALEALAAQIGSTTGPPRIS